MLVLSMDPGTSNFAASVLRTDLDEDIKVRVEGTKLVKNTITNVQKSCEQIAKFRKELRAIEKDVGKFDLVVAERFQSRGHGGTTIESINMMLGAIALTYPMTEFYTASVWKNAFNKYHDLKGFYEDHKSMVASTPKKDRRTVHELDSSLMGIYHSAKFFGTEPFSNLGSERKLQKFLKHWNASKEL